MKLKTVELVCFCQMSLFCKFYSWKLLSFYTPGSGEEEVNLTEIFFQNEYLVLNLWKYIV